MEKVEQIQTFFKSLGLEDSDFEKLSKEDIEDFTPFVEKAKHGIKEVLLTDNEWIDSITKPFKDAPIGKEKQLKKEVRSFFGLQLKEDELAKMPLKDILAKGTEALKTADHSEIEKYKTAYSELLEENEKLKNETLPNALKEVEETWKSKVTNKEIKETLMEVVASETQVDKANISLFSTTFQGYLSQSGLSLALDEKKNLSIRNSDGLPVKNSEGGVLKVKDALKDFATKMQVNLKPIGTPPAGGGGNGTSRYKNRLELMGKGFPLAR